MNQCSPVEVHSLREARALSRVSCQFSVASSQLTITTEHGHRVSTTGNGALTTDNLLEMGEKSEGKISAPGDLLRHCADLRLCWIEENSVHRATYCAIAWIIIARAGWRKSQCTGAPTAPLRGSPLVLDGGKLRAPGDLLRHCADHRLCWTEENSVHRATYCAHN